MPAKKQSAQKTQRLVQLWIKKGGRFQPCPSSIYFVAVIWRRPSGSKKPDAKVLGEEDRTLNDEKKKGKIKNLLRGCSQDLGR